MVSDSNGIENICPVHAFTTSEELALSTGDGNTVTHVKYDSANDLMYWLEDNNIYRGLSDDRYTSASPCFREAVLTNGKLGSRSWLWVHLPPNYCTQQNSYSIGHLLGTVTTQWLHSDGVVIGVNCRQHGDYTAIGSSVTVPPAVVNSDYTVTVQSLCSHCA